MSRQHWIILTSFIMFVLKYFIKDGTSSYPLTEQDFFSTGFCHQNKYLGEKIKIKTKPVRKEHLEHYKVVCGELQNFITNSILKERPFKNGII